MKILLVYQCGCINIIMTKLKAVHFFQSFLPMYYPPFKKDMINITVQYFKKRIRNKNYGGERGEGVDTLGYLSCEN